MNKSRSRAYNRDVSFILFKNDRKLHSLLSPLNLNLNYENFVFDAKVLLLFEMTKHFGKKMQNFFNFILFRLLK